MNKGRSGRRITTRSQENTEAVRQALESYQGRISARRNILGILSSWFCCIIKKDLRWYPYEKIRCYNLKDGDYERRSRFCQRFLNQCNNRRFLANFAIGDEAGFALNGAVNNHNVRMYAPANQRSSISYNVNGCRQKLIVRVGLCENGDMLGPFFFDGNVIGQSYLNFLNDEVIPLMTGLFQNQFHENRFQRLWWAQDGAPCHGLLAVVARLNRLFVERVLSLHTSNGWPPRSPNLTH